MKKYPLIPWVRLSLASLTIIAILVQLIDGVQNERSVANFFSFFTIESNILAAGLLFFMGLAGLGRKERRNISYLRGAITLYMSMTGVIYMTLLAHNPIALQTTIPWVNMVLHYIMPVAVLLDWLLIPPRSHISYKKALLWLIFPLAYLLYSFIRGAIVSWYPYPFINPMVNSWPQIIFMSILIGLGILVIMKVIIWRSPSK